MMVRFGVRVRLDELHRTLDRRRLYHLSVEAERKLGSSDHLSKGSL